MRVYNYCFFFLFGFSFLQKQDYAITAVMQPVLLPNTTLYFHLNRYIFATSLEDLH